MKGLDRVQPSGTYGVEGRLLAVVQVIEVLANEWEKNYETPANQPGTSVK